MVRMDQNRAEIQMGTSAVPEDPCLGKLAEVPATNAVAGRL